MGIQKFQIQIISIEVRLDAYIDEDWELREDDPLVQTWQACEEKLPEELKDEEWDT